MSSCRLACSANRPDGVIRDSWPEGTFSLCSPCRSYSWEPRPRQQNKRTRDRLHVVETRQIISRPLEAYTAGRRSSALRQLHGAAHSYLHTALAPWSYLLTFGCCGLILNLERRRWDEAEGSKRAPFDSLSSGFLFCQTLFPTYFACLFPFPLVVQGRR